MRRQSRFSMGFEDWDVEEEKVLSDKDLH